MQILIFITLLAAVYADEHVKCVRNYDNIGCFKEHSPGQKDLVINDRDNIDWNNIAAYMHSLACRCNEKTREKNKGRKVSNQYVGFALHYYGECYGRTAKDIADIKDKSHKEHLCIGDQSYTRCIQGEHKECTGIANAEYIYQFKVNAPKNVDGGYTKWAAWTKCQSECGPGMRIRERTCTNPEPEGDGKDCKALGNNTESKACMNKPCPVDGGLSEWSGFGECSKKCAGGVQSRSRTCTNPSPAHGGSDCEGETKESQSCNTGPCPVDGGWSSWSGYDRCTASCGGGTHKRIRGCTNPPPMYGGKDCVGPTTETKACGTANCPVDGGYTRWSNYGACNKKCGGGTQYRSRTCTNPAPAHGGRNCRGLGPATESRPCNQHACPIKEFSTHCCEGGSVFLSCTGSDRIRIRHAMYGRRSRSICKHWLSWAMRTNCQAGNSYSKVSSSCNGHKACRVYAKNHVFGDPCWGTTKYLQVTYRCQ